MIQYVSFHDKRKTQTDRNENYSISDQNKHCSTSKYFIRKQAHYSDDEHELHKNQQQNISD